MMVLSTGRPKEQTCMDKLGQFLAKESGVNLDEVMLLRHSTSTIKYLSTVGVTVKQYTEVQPKNKRYDYYHDHTNPIKMVAVIVENKVNQVYRILGVEREGTNYSLNTPKLTELDKKGRRPEVPARRFKLEEFGSSAIGENVRGWERRQRTTVQRSEDSFFSEIEVECSLVHNLPWEDDERSAFEERVQTARRESKAVRARRLLDAPEFPDRQVRRTLFFKRNPYVSAEVLDRANGRCELCKQSAPFLRRMDKSPPD